MEAAQYQLGMKQVEALTEVATGQGKQTVILPAAALDIYARLTEGSSFATLLDWGETYLGAVTGNNETILVVEDDAEVRKLVIEMLAELGYATIEAENGIQALGKIDAHNQIALMITDVVMPGMNGRVLAGEVHLRRPALPVLFTTGYTRNAIVHHGVLDPDVHVIIKPYTIETLAAKVQELLQAAKG